jgi:hypothetical protein
VREYLAHGVTGWNNGTNLGKQTVKHVPPNLFPPNLINLILLMGSPLPCQGLGLFHVPIKGNYVTWYTRLNSVDIDTLSLCSRSLIWCIPLQTSSAWQVFWDLNAKRLRSICFPKVGCNYLPPPLPSCMKKHKKNTWSIDTWFFRPLITWLNKLSYVSSFLTRKLRTQSLWWFHNYQRHWKSHARYQSGNTQNLDFC